jgi:MFS transporter, DHA3 family, multidrug efflux protein
MRKFYTLLANHLFASVSTGFVWFAVTFWIYLQTRSVMMTAYIAGIFTVCNLLSAFAFGKYVDNNKKKTSFIVGSFLSLLFFIAATVLFYTYDLGAVTQYTSVPLWIFIILCVAGSVCGNLRQVALSVAVNLFFEESKRDRGNGLVATVSAISFGLTSVLSGFAISYIGMGYSMLAAIFVTALVILHATTLRIEEPDIQVKEVDKSDSDTFKKTFAYIQSTPILLPLILFTVFNNFLGGVFMALMDAYGLSLVSVQVWGVLWGVLSLTFIISGLFISRYGIGKNPAQTIMVCNFVSWFVCIFFSLYGSIILFLIGVITWMLLGPYIESAEQTILQKIVEYQNQGKVIGFSQTLESAVTPATAFLIGPLAEFFFIPFMNEGLGKIYLGSFYGEGNMAGIGLIFSITGLLGTIFAVWAMRTKTYKELYEKCISN